jgi:hypothetical protein
MVSKKVVNSTTPFQFSTNETNQMHGFGQPLNYDMQTNLDKEKTIILI